MVRGSESQNGNCVQVSKLRYKTRDKEERRREDEDALSIPLSLCSFPRGVVVF